MQMYHHHSRHGASNRAAGAAAEEEADELAAAVGEEYSDDEDDVANADINVGEEENYVRTTQLPIKRKGLSKYYQGKSQSFSSFAEVRCVDDLAKKERTMTKPNRRSYAGGISDDDEDDDSDKKTTIPWKASSSRENLSLCRARTTSGGSCFNSTGKPPPRPAPINAQQCIDR